jgi:hypothetical protein
MMQLSKALHLLARVGWAIAALCIFAAAWLEQGPFFAAAYAVAGVVVVIFIAIPQKRAREREAEQAKDDERRRQCQT